MLGNLMNLRIDSKLMLRKSGGESNGFGVEAGDLVHP